MKILIHVCFLFVALTAFASAQSQSSHPQNINVNPIDDKSTPEKPEARQIGTVLPYNWYQGQQSIGSPPSTSWVSPSTWGSNAGQSLLSILRPSMTGGRRSSLTSRLRNLMNAIFYRRDTSTPYIGSGSSYSYAFRQPPYGFASTAAFPSVSGIGSGIGSGLGSGIGSGLGSGISSSIGSGIGSGLGSGLGSGIGSGIGSSLGSSLSSSIGSALSSIGSSGLYASGSSYRPVVLPSSYQSSVGDSWSNYKQYAPSAQSSYISQYASQSSPTSWSSTVSGSLPSWQSASQTGNGASYGSSYPSYSSGISSGLSSGLSSGISSGVSSGSSSGSGSYQAAASSLYPSSSYQRYDKASQVSSSYNVKPSSSSSYSSGSVASSGSSSGSPSSSVSSSSSSVSSASSSGSGKSAAYHSQ